MPTPACHCGFLPCTADPDAAIVMLWDHIEKAHAGVVEHKGCFEWRNPAEQVWECDDDCPHPSHEEQP